MGMKKKMAGTWRRGGLAEFARLFRSMVDSYRPELHYMRGPGPKYRAKASSPALPSQGVNAVANTNAKARRK